jgi:hypothetical protein
MAESMWLAGKIEQSAARFRLSDISEIVQAVLDRIDHGSDFSSSGIKPRLTSSS